MHSDDTTPSSHTVGPMSPDFPAQGTGPSWVFTRHAALTALEADVETFIRREKLFTPGQRVLIACSGGVDSTMLVALLFRLRVRLQISLYVCHIHHGLRGKDADADATVVEALASRLELPVHVIRLTGLAEPRAQKGSLQEAARTARYAAMLSLAAQEGYGCIATGHTASDQAETVLHHLARGAGLHGLCGIPPRRAPGVVRPLLEIPRARLEAVAVQQGIEWREDASNTSRKYTRNRIRQDLMPALKALNPSVELTLATSLRQMRREDALLEHLTDTLAAAPWVEYLPGSLRLDRRMLDGLDEALRGRLLYRLVSTLRPSQEVSSVHIEGLLDRLQEHRGTRIVSLPGGVRAVLEPAVLTLMREEQVSGLLTGWDAGREARVSVPGRVLLEGGVWLDAGVSQEAPEWRVEQRADTVCFSEEVLLETLSVRAPRPADRFWPWGRAGDSSLAEFLSHQKIPRIQRRTWPLVVSNDRILWVVGLRRSAWFPVVEERGRCLLLRLRRDVLDVEKCCSMNNPIHSDPVCGEEKQ